MKKALLTKSLLNTNYGNKKLFRLFPQPWRSVWSSMNKPTLERKNIWYVKQFQHLTIVLRNDSTFLPGSILLLQSKLTWAFDPIWTSTSTQDIFQKTEKKMVMYVKSLCLLTSVWKWKKYYQRNSNTKTSPLQKLKSMFLTKPGLSCVSFRDEVIRGHMSTFW